MKNKHTRSILSRSNVVGCTLFIVIIALLLFAIQLPVFGISSPSSNCAVGSLLSSAACRELRHEKFIPHEGDNTTVIVQEVADPGCPSGIMIRRTSYVFGQYSWRTKNTYALANAGNKCCTLDSVSECVLPYTGHGNGYASTIVGSCKQ